MFNSHCFALGPGYSPDSVLLGIALGGFGGTMWCWDWNLSLLHAKYKLILFIHLSGPSIF